MMKKFTLVFLLLILALANACGNSASLEVRLTDKAAIVVDGHTINTALVTISEVSVHTSASAGENAAGWQAIALSNNVDINLLNLQNGVNQLLGRIDLPAGSYQQIRLTVASATITIDGSPTPVPVTISSGILKMNLGVSLVAGNNYGVILDFSAADSLNLTGATWRMAPPVITVREIYRINADLTHTPL